MDLAGTITKYYRQSRAFEFEGERGVQHNYTPFQVLISCIKDLSYDSRKLLLDAARIQQKVRVNIHLYAAYQKIRDSAK
jgi:hypothetical protein